jgi:uncharacterized protein
VQLGPSPATRGFLFRRRGQATGKVWSAVIDASAILLCLVSLTGLILIWFIHKRRTAGLTLAALGAILCYLAYRLFIP